MGRLRRVDKPVVAERRTKLVQYRIEGRPYTEFYEELGYSSPSAASKDFSRVIEERILQQRESVDVYRELEIQRLDAELARLARLYLRVADLLDREHVTISFGKVIYHDGSPVPDDSPFLQVVDRLLRIEDARRRNAERRAKLLGLDAPQQVEVLTIDDIDQNIRRLSDELAALDGEAPEVEGAEAPPE